MLRTVVETAVIVPGLWRWELYNALLVAERRGRVSSEDIGRMLEEMQALRFEFDSTPNLDAATELTLARKFSLTAYDAAYLELAIRKSARLMTRDSELANAAEQMGLLWTP